MLIGRLRDKLFDHKWVALIDVTVDLRVQQPLREGKVREMLRRGFDLSLSGEITASARSDGTVVILDGQTRVEAARRSNVDKLWMRVWHDLPIADEAWLFTYLNRKSNPVAVSTFKTRVLAEEDVPSGIAEILTGLGWRISESKDNGVFMAVSQAERIYRSKGIFKSLRPGSQIFSRTLETLTEAWGLNKTASDASIVGGLAVFLIRYWDQVDQKKLVDALRRITPELLRAEAKATQKGTGCNVVEAHGYKIHQHYNKRTRTKLPAFAI